MKVLNFNLNTPIVKPIASRIDFFSNFNYATIQKRLDGLGKNATETKDTLCIQMHTFTYSMYLYIYDAASFITVKKDFFLRRYLIHSG